MSRRLCPTVRMEPVRPTVRDLPPIEGIVTLPTPREEALNLLRDIDPHNSSQVGATRRIIDVTERQEAILLVLSEGDFAARHLVVKMVRFRKRVLRAFDRLVVKACQS
jgi:hypothetical protein